MQGATFRNSRAYINDASFVKLRELSFSYALPNAIMSRMFSSARDVRLELAGRNLKTWTDYTGLDPETSNNGNQNVILNVHSYPPTVVVLSVSANF